MEILTEAESKQFSSFLDSFSNPNESSNNGLNGSNLNHSVHNNSSIPSISNSFNQNIGNYNSTTNPLINSSSTLYNYQVPLLPPSLPSYPTVQINQYYPKPTNNNNNHNFRPQLNNHSNSQPSLHYPTQFPQHYQAQPTPYQTHSIPIYNPIPRPNFHNSLSAPLPSTSSNPISSSAIHGNANLYPTQPLTQLDDESRRRMIEQTRELEEWMSSKIPNSKGKGIDLGCNIRVGSRNRQQEEIDRLEESPPKRIRSLESLDNDQSYENASGGAAISRGGNKQARSTTSNSSRKSKKEVKESYPPLGATASTIKKPVKLKAATTASKKEVSPPLSDVIDHVRNPPPFATPSNIPPSPFSSRPTTLPLQQIRPQTSNSTSTSSASPTKPTKKSKDSTKPILLSTEQKKANHIASEQKRRAAIRSGYEGLCSVVPSLKAAVEEFEERVKKVSSSTGGGTGKKKGGNNTHGALMGGIEVGGEKVDGRAGPRSEAVVLGKCV